MRRIVRPELLDTGQATPAEIQASLHDLQFVNRWFGGVSTTRQILERVAQRTNTKELRILDVGSATGDGPLQLRQSCPNLRLDVTLLDREPSRFNGIAHPPSCVTADALALPFRDNSFDVVCCSLFAHHLEPEQIAAFARESLRVARIAFTINDLRRSFVHLALVYGGMPLYRSRVTRHDAPVSIWRAYTPDEVRKVLATATSKPVDVFNTYLCRMGAIAWK
ncbi:MAG TPA: methyltransferase domain-containing protein [Terriglobales bacterium]|nr:methyltransferase domain-containing protein [Terriglobales bacterium]